MKTRKDFIKDFDYKLLILVIIISAFGILILKSAATSLDDYRSIMKSQIVATVLGFFAIVLFSVIDYRIWKNLYKFIYVVSMLLLAATLVFGVSAYGSKSWLSIGGFTFQPSEFVKVSLIIAFAAYLEDVEYKLNEPFELFKALVFAFLPVFLILKQPDAGTAMVYTFFIVVMLFIAGVDWKYILAAVILFLAAIPIIWTKLDLYQKNRILGFLNPAAGQSDTTYQFVQGMIAIGSGQIKGKGLYKGTQTQYGFVPKKENDFIFPVLAEELGFIGGFLLILLYGLILLEFIKIAKNSKDRFGSFMILGFVAMLLFHIWENIGMCLGLMPITGIPLPFFSAGGTFQLICLSIMGLVLSVSAHKNSEFY